MPWFCYTEIGCNLDIDAAFLKQLRLSTRVDVCYTQQGVSSYRMVATMPDKRITVDLVYGDDRRWKQAGRLIDTPRRAISIMGRQLLI
jgi:hypothetical protein